MISKRNLIKPSAVAGSLSCLVFLSACLEDEAQVRELRQLREKLIVAEKKATEAAQEAETARRELAEAAHKPADTGVADRLRQSEQRVAELEARLAEASKQAAASAPVSGGAFRDHARQVQQNLMEQMGALSETLQARQSGPSLEEITVKKIQSGFRSELVFSVRAGDRVRKLAFPVEADLDGRWNLPSAEIINSHFGNADVAASAQGHATAATPALPTAGPPSSPPATPNPTPAPNVAAAPLPVADTIIIQWDRPAGRPAQTTSPAPAAPVAPTQPSVAPKAVPKAVMPVTKDVQIRFD